jgi:biotin synthase
MEVMALYPANSMFIDGYLNVEGSMASRTLEMIRDAGFTVKTNSDDTEQLKQEETEKRDVLLKELKVLRPHMESDA